MNKLVQKVAVVGLVSGSCIFAVNARPAAANPAEYRTYDRTEVPYVRTNVYEVRPVSYLPTYIRTSEYCETNRTRFSGVWTRRGTSPVYDIVWTDYNGERIYGSAEVVENNNGYLTLNYHAGHNSGYYQVRYDSRDSISGTWRDVNGHLWGSVTAYVQL